MERNIKKYLTFDLESVSGEKSHDELFKNNPTLCELWDKKVEQKYKAEKDVLSDNEIYIKYAGLYPEFGKIICISLGYIDKDNNLKVKAYSGDDELLLLTQVFRVLHGFYDKDDELWLAGFNCNNFDIPYVIRRALIKNVNLSIPVLLKVTDKKPWELRITDIMTIWQFGNRDMITMKLMSEVLGVKHYKDVVDSSKLSEMYWAGLITLDKVEEYCNGDVKNTIELLQILLLKI